MARELQSLGHEVAMCQAVRSAGEIRRCGRGGDLRGGKPAETAQELCAPIKSPEQQGAQMLARVRNQFIGRRTQLANSIRGYAAEFGFTADNIAAKAKAP